MKGSRVEIYHRFKLRTVPCKHCMSIALNMHILSTKHRKKSNLHKNIPNRIFFFDPIFSYFIFVGFLNPIMANVLFLLTEAHALSYTDPCYVHTRVKKHTICSKAPSEVQKVCAQAVDKLCSHCLFQAVGTACSKLDGPVRPNCCF